MSRGTSIAAVLIMASVSPCWPPCGGAAGCCATSDVTEQEYEDGHNDGLAHRNLPRNELYRLNRSSNAFRASSTRGVVVSRSTVVRGAYNGHEFFEFFGVIRAGTGCMHSNRLPGSKDVHCEQLCSSTPHRGHRLSKPHVGVRDHSAARCASHDGAESRHVDGAWFDLRDTPRGGRRARFRCRAGGLRFTFAIPIVVLVSALSIFAFAHGGVPPFRARFYAVRQLRDTPTSDMVDAIDSATLKGSTRECGGESGPTHPST